MIRQGVISREEFRKGVVELGFLACLPSEIDRLFSVFDRDGSGDISFKELHRMLRKRVVEQPRKTVTEPEGVVDLDDLRENAKRQALTMSVQAELHFATVIDDLTGNQITGRLGVLPNQVTQVRTKEGEDGEGEGEGNEEAAEAIAVKVDVAKMAAAKTDVVKEMMIDSMEADMGIDLDGDGDIGVW